MDGWMDGWINVETYGRTDVRTDVRTYGRTDGRTDERIHLYSINQSIKKIIPHKLQSSRTYSRHQGSNVERGKLKCNTYKTLSPIINYS